MIFYILLFWLPSIYLLVVLFDLIFFNDYNKGTTLVIAPFVIIPVLVFPLFTWFSHSDDLGTIKAQHELIEVYEKEIQEINKRLSEFNYPDGALMNADTPVASIVQSLSHLQGLLAEARTAEAKAKKAIEQRRFGPMSGVIDFVGDYK